MSSLRTWAVMTRWPQRQLKAGVSRERGRKYMWNWQWIGGIPGIPSGNQGILTGHHQWWVPRKLSRRCRHAIVPRLVCWSWHHHWRLRARRRHGVTRLIIQSTWEEKKQRERVRERTSTRHPHSPCVTISSCLASGSESTMNKSKFHCLEVTQEVRHWRPESVLRAPNNTSLWERRFTP